MGTAVVVPMETAQQAVTILPCSEEEQHQQQIEEIKLLLKINQLAGGNSMVATLATAQQLMTGTTTANIFLATINW